MSDHPERSALVDLAEVAPRSRWLEVLGPDVFDLSPVALAVVDATHLTVLAANQAMANQVGMTVPAVVGQTWPAPLGASPEEALALRDALARGETEMDVRAGHGTDAVWWRMRIARVDHLDGAPFLIIEASDRTDQHRHASQLEQIVDRDDLTGLWNRRRFARELRRMLDPAQTHPVGVVLIDVNSFKQVNDTHGHAAGDEALRAVADSLLTSAPPGSLVARLAGDEFAALVLGGTDEETKAFAMSVARPQPVHVPGLPVEVTLSAGWTLAEPGEDPDQRASDALIEADLSMYAAKARARHGPRPVGRSESGVPTAWLERDPADVAEADLELWSHPILSLPDRRLHQHDVVLQTVRDDQTARTATPPVLTLGAVTSLLDHIRRDAARRVAEPDRYLVHLPALPLGVGSAVSWIGRAVTDMDMAPSTVTFALPESVLDGGGEAVEVLAELRRIGFGLAITSFGAELGPVRLLADLEPDQVWFHSSITSSGARLPWRSALVESVLVMARRGGVQVGVVGSGEDLDALGPLLDRVDLALVPDPGALRPLGSVSTA